MSTERAAADDHATPQPASDVRAIEPVDADALATAKAQGPSDEPDRTVWRVLACARAAGAIVSDEALQRLLSSFTLVEIAGARARVQSATVADLSDDASLVERLAEPSLTFDEAVICGLLDDGGAAKRA